MMTSISQQPPFYSPPLGLDDSSATHRTKRQTPEASDSVWSYSDRRLLHEVAKHYDEYTAGTGDSYVRFQDLKEAAGQLPTSRSFSQDASDVAKELLARPKLLENLDIGVSFSGGNGLKDERFDHTNINAMTWRVTDRPKIRISFDDGDY